LFVLVGFVCLWFFCVLVVCTFCMYSLYVHWCVCFLCLLVLWKGCVWFLWLCLVAGLLSKVL
jgi:hypothetical protein